jgi:hypothetical protein
MTGELFWKDIEKALSFDDRVLPPNSPTLIYEGDFELEASESEHYLTLIGKIEQYWIPLPQVRFVGISSKPNHNMFNLLSKKFNSTKENLFFECIITCMREVNDSVEYGGLITGSLLSGSKVPVDEVRFSLVNFPDFRGHPVKQLCEDTNIRRLDSLTLIGNGWTLRIDQRFKCNDYLDEVCSRGGFVSTHSCSLRRFDGDLFDYSDAIELINSLQYFFGFLAGRWCGPILTKGLIDNSRSCWDGYGSFHLSSTSQGDSWFPLNYSSDIENLFSGFLDLWNSEVWSGPLLQTVHWIITANTSHNPIETHIISAFVPLEMLSWLILVEYKSLYSNKEFKNNFGKAEAKLAELLRVTGISNDLPKHMQSLLASSSDQNLGDKDLSDENSPNASKILVKIRNAITHPHKTNREFLRQTSGFAKYEAKELCLEFVELILLQNMNYSGRYRRRAFKGWNGDEYAYVPWRGGVRL